ncbi:MAG TPA: response regulator [Candidatus Acidoferrum sp.]|nr:response regulator [Candidatus Acidoferrum sp.]
MVIRILVADDFVPWRRLVSSIVQKEPEWRVVCETSDGLEAVQKAEELKPDVILLDIGLPKLNGIEAARQIRKLVPSSKILFLSAIVSPDIAREALNTGTSGYVVKSDAGSELVSAVEAVFQGKRFVSSKLRGRISGSAEDTPATGNRGRNEVLASPSAIPRNTDTTRCHEVQFYSNDAGFLDNFTHFIGAALRAGNAVIVAATESHRHSLHTRLQARGLDLAAAIEQGSYISLDADETLSTFMVNDLPDPVRFSKVVGDLIVSAAKAAKGEHPRVAVCGECAARLWAQGKGEAAIWEEQLWDEIAKIFDVDILCGYPPGSFHRQEGSHIFQRICAEHSAVYSV